MKKITLLAITLLLFNSCFAKLTPNANLQSLINPPISSQKNTWIGADIGTSIELSPHRYLWLFGDTSLGISHFPARYVNSKPNIAMIHNSVGIMNCDQTHCQKIQKYLGWKHNHPVSFFQTQNSNDYYWVQAGARIKDKLFLTAAHLQTASNMKMIGTTFLLVDHVDQTPDHWRIVNRLDIKQTKANINWSAGVVKTKNNLFIIGEKGNGFDRQAIISRLSFKDILNSDWKKLSLQSNQIIKGLPGTSEISIVPGKKHRWVSVEIPPFEFDIKEYYADRLQGPWHAGPALYHIPAPWSTTKTNGHATYICYAAKLHPELASNKHDLVVTYNINTNGFDLGLQGLAIFANNLKQPKYKSLYIPQFLI